MQGVRPLSAPARAAVVVGVVVGVVGVVVGLAVLWAFDPMTAGFFPPCPIYALTGWSCPGCGSTRMAHALLHGELRAAWAHNPFVLTVGSAFLVKLVTPPLPDRVAVGVTVVVVVGAVVFGVARNL